MVTPRIDRELCIGCGDCEATAPKVFKLDDESIATVIDPQGDTEELIREAAENCPVDAIILTDASGKQVYP